MAFKLGLTVDLCMRCLSIHARVDDLDLDARSQGVGKGQKQISVEYYYLDNLASDEHQTFFFYSTLTLKTCIWLNYLGCCFSLSHHFLCPCCHDLSSREGRINHSPLTLGFGDSSARTRTCMFKYVVRLEVERSIVFFPGGMNFASRTRCVCAQLSETKSSSP